MGGDKGWKRLDRPIEIIYQVADCLISDPCVCWDQIMEWSIGSLKGKWFEDYTV